MQEIISGHICRKVKSCVILIGIIYFSFELRTQLGSWVHYQIEDDVSLPAMRSSRARI